MTIPAYARLAARLLRREHEQLPKLMPPADALRDDAVAAIERALTRRAQRQRLRRSAFAALGIAASIGLVFVARATIAPQQLARPAPSGTTSALPPSQDIVVHAFGDGARVTGDTHGALRAPGGRVQLPADGRALLAFKTGTRVTLEGGGDITLVQNDAAQVLALDRGALRADVAKLAPGRRFLVHTPDAEVEVHGTSFRVLTNTDAARCGAESRTRVEVFEGVVTVRHAGVEQRVLPGERWPTSCPEASPASVTAPVARAPAVSSPPPSASTGAAPAFRGGAAFAASSSQLVEQNDAFAAAVAARDVGDLARAARGFAALRARFPDGPLTESAAVQHLKVMLELDRARAPALARDYLQHYPNGFARELAAAIAAESP